MSTIGAGSGSGSGSGQGSANSNSNSNNNNSNNNSSNEVTFDDLEEGQSYKLKEHFVLSNPEESWIEHLVNQESLDLLFRDFHTIREINGNEIIFDLNPDDPDIYVNAIINPLEYNNRADPVPRSRRTYITLQVDDEATELLPLTYDTIFIKKNDKYYSANKERKSGGKRKSQKKKTKKSRKVRKSKKSLKRKVRKST